MSHHNGHTIEIFDTDICSEYQRGTLPAVTRLHATICERRHTTIVTDIELQQGRFQQLRTADTKERMIAAQTAMDRTRAFLAETFASVLPMDEQVASTFFDLLKRRGLKKIGRRDLMIAAIALRHDATLVTGNVKHFERVPRLKLTDWRGR
jgi:predicted nucleic acid-binding protein